MTARSQIAIESSPAHAVVAALMTRARAAQATFQQYTQARLDEVATAAAWWPKLPGLTYQGVDELTTGWSGSAWAGRFANTIPGYGVRIYSWLPQKLVAGRGL